MKYDITFASSGVMTIEAETEQEARRIFMESEKEHAAEVLESQGIEITDIQEAEE